MVIDFHVHCFPEDLAPKAVPVLAARAGIPARLDGTIGQIKDSMKAAGVDKSVVLSIATKPTQTQRVNNWSEEIQDDSIIAFGSLHPENGDWQDEIRRIKSLGLKGIKFHPEYQEFYVDDPQMMEMYQLAFSLGLIVVFHAGVDIGMPKPYHCTPERLLNVVRRFPENKIVAAHMGGYLYWDEVEKYLVGENLYLDTSYSIGFMEDAQAVRIIRNHGVEKILFASDSPWIDQKEQLERLESLGLDDSEKRAILGANAKLLLNIE